MRVTIRNFDVTPDGHGLEPFAGSIGVLKKAFCSEFYSKSKGTIYMSVTWLETAYDTPSGFETWHYHLTRPSGHPVMDESKKVYEKKDKKRRQKEDKKQKKSDPWRSAETAEIIAQIILVFFIIISFWSSAWDENHHVDKRTAGVWDAMEP